MLVGISGNDAKNQLQALEHTNWKWGVHDGLAKGITPEYLGTWIIKHSQVLIIWEKRWKSWQKNVGLGEIIIYFIFWELIVR